jgi:hypothetical protein
MKFLDLPFDRRRLELSIGGYDGTNIIRFCFTTSLLRIVGIANNPQMQMVSDGLDVRPWLRR